MHSSSKARQESGISPNIRCIDSDGLFSCIIYGHVGHLLSYMEGRLVPKLTNFHRTEGVHTKETGIILPAV